MGRGIEFAGAGGVLDGAAVVSRGRQHVTRRARSSAALAGARLRDQPPIIVADPAYIDELHWAEQKRLRRAAIISREEANMQPTVIARHAFDPDDPVNRGVEADEQAGYHSLAGRQGRPS
jgi:hypothetical protein